MFPEDFPAMSTNQQTVGCAIAAFLEQCGVKAAFGVISIHNMPILDAFGERGNIRFMMARGEAGGATWPTPMREPPAAWACA
jgi:acetolactate synthase-1/2/3 large subunit